MKHNYKISVLTVAAVLGLYLEAAYGQGAPTTLPPPVKIQATIANTAALHVERAGNQPSAIDLYGNGGGNDIRFRVPDGAGGQQLMSYFNDSGAWFGRGRVVISGSYSGTPAGSTIQAPTADPIMLGIWSDIYGSAMIVRPNQYDAAPPVNSCVATMDGAGKYRFSIHPDGSLNFAAANSNVIGSAGFDAKLYRSGAGRLSATGSFSAGAIKDTVSVIMMINNSTSSVSDGAIVVLDPTRANAFLPATTDLDTKVVGAVQGTIAAGASGPVVVQGIRQVSVTGTINRGDRIVTAAGTGVVRRVAAGETVPSGSVIGKATSTAVSGRASVMISSL